MEAFKRIISFQFNILGVLCLRFTAFHKEKSLKHFVRVREKEIIQAQKKGLIINKTD